MGEIFGYDLGYLSWLSGMVLYKVYGGGVIIAEISASASSSPSHHGYRLRPGSPWDYGNLKGSFFLT